MAIIKVAKMMKFLYILMLMLIAIKVNSVPIGLEEKQQVSVESKRDQLENINNNVAKKVILAQELSNTSLSSFLKDLYLNSSYLVRGLSHQPEDNKATTAIQSYKNQAKSKSCSHVIHLC